jgi:hypothetical protein
VTVLEEFERIGELVRRVPFGPTPDAREIRAEALVLVAATALGNIETGTSDFGRDSRLASYLIYKANTWLRRNT